MRIGPTYKDQVDRWFSMVLQRGQNMTVYELSKASGLSAGTVWKMYHGRTKHPRMMTLMKLAQAVGLGFDLQEATSLVQFPVDSRAMESSSVNGSVPVTKKKRTKKTKTTKKRGMRKAG